MESVLGFGGEFVQFDFLNFAYTILTDMGTEKAFPLLISVCLVYGLSMRLVGLLIGGEIRESIYFYNQMVFVISALLCGIMIILLHRKQKLPTHAMAATVFASLGSSLVSFFEFMRLGDLFSFSWSQIQSNLVQGKDSVMSMDLSSQMIIIMGMAVGGLLLTLWYSLFYSRKIEGPLKRAYNRVLIAFDNIIWLALLLIGLATLCIFSPLQVKSILETPLIETLSNVLHSALVVPFMIVFFHTLGGSLRSIGKKWDLLLDLAVITYAEIALILGLALYEYQPLSMHLLVFFGFLGAITGLSIAVNRLAYISDPKGKNRKSSYRRKNNGSYIWGRARSAFYTLQDFFTGLDQHYYLEKIISVRFLVLILLTIYILFIFGFKLQGSKWFTNLTGILEPIRSTISELTIKFLNPMVVAVKDLFYSKEPIVSDGVIVDNGVIMSNEAPNSSFWSSFWWG